MPDHPRTRRLLGAALLAALVSACAASPGGSASMSLVPTASPVVSPSPPPTAAQTSSAASDSWVPACRATGSESDQGWMSAVAPGGPGLITAGTNGTPSHIGAWAWTSTDGSTWTEAQLPGAEGAYPGAIAANAQGLIIGATVGNNEGAIAWHSPDGRLWERATLDASVGEVVAGAADATTYVIGGARAQRPVIWSSADGSAWRPVGPGLDGSLYGFVRGIVAGGPGFIAWGVVASAPIPDVWGPNDPKPDTGAIWTSVDGTTWARLADPFSGGGVMRIISVGSRLLAFGTAPDSSPATWSSTDGLGWTRLPAGLPSVDQTPYFVGLEGSRILELDQPAASPIRAWMSNDGTAWKPVTGPSSIGWTIEGAATYGASIIAVGTSDAPAVQTGCNPIPIWTRSIASFGAGG